MRCGFGNVFARRGLVRVFFFVLCGAVRCCPSRPARKKERKDISEGGGEEERNEGRKVVLSNRSDTAVGWLVYLAVCRGGERMYARDYSSYRSFFVLRFWW